VVIDYLYRIDMFENREIDRIFINKKQKLRNKILESYKEEMMERLPRFLPERVVEMYIKSRFE
jgi:hypothetical protein